MKSVTFNIVVLVAAVMASAGEARCVALESSYVHEVYEEISGGCGGGLGGPRTRHCPCAGGGGGGGGGFGRGGLGPGGAAGGGVASGGTGDRAWPRVAQFLNDLEPGALVCDVGA